MSNNQKISIINIDRRIDNFMKRIGYIKNHDSDSVVERTYYNNEECEFNEVLYINPSKVIDNCCRITKLTRHFKEKRNQNDPGHIYMPGGTDICILITFDNYINRNDVFIKNAANGLFSINYWIYDYDSAYSTADKQPMYSYQIIYSMFDETRSLMWGLCDMVSKTNKDARKIRNKLRQTRHNQSRIKNTPYNGQVNRPVE